MHHGMNGGMKDDMALQYMIDAIQNSIKHFQGPSTWVHILFS